MNTDSAIETPDTTRSCSTRRSRLRLSTIWHSCRKRFRSPRTRTPAPNTGTRFLYRPLQVRDLQPGKGFNLVRNDQWDPATDPNRKALPDRIEVTLNVNADDLDNRLLSGDLDIDVVGGWSLTGSTKPESAGSEPQGERGQPVYAAPVHLDQPDRSAIRQYRVPEGDHVRHGPHFLPDRVRWRDCRWRPGHDDPAAEHPRP